MLGIANFEYLQTFVEFTDIGTVIDHQDCHCHSSVIELPHFFENDFITIC